MLAAPSAAKAPQRAGSVPKLVQNSAAADSALRQEKIATARNMLRGEISPEDTARLGPTRPAPSLPCV